MTSGLTFDAGGLIALDRGDRRVVVLVARADETGATITIPATALAQAIRRPERQVRLARLIRQPRTNVVALDRVDASNVGRLLAASSTADISTLVETATHRGIFVSLIPHSSSSRSESALFNDY